MTQYKRSATIERFKRVAVLEGVSFLVLLVIAMPLKYIWDLPWMVRQVGLAHGILFILYVIGIPIARKKLNWNFQQTGIAFLAGFVPFGTFYVTSRMIAANHGTGAD
jgi:integral membrane protein